jgi:hypothetical protein
MVKKFVPITSEAVTQSPRARLTRRGDPPTRRKQIAEQVFELLASGLSRYGAIGADGK